MSEQLRKSSSDKVLSGVCGGIAEYFSIPSYAVRLIFIFIPANLVIYLILSFTLPESPLTL